MLPSLSLRFYLDELTDQKPSDVKAVAMADEQPDLQKKAQRLLFPFRLVQTRTRRIEVPPFASFDFITSNRITQFAPLTSLANFSHSRFCWHCCFIAHPRMHQLERPGTSDRAVRQTAIKRDNLPLPS